MEKGQMMLTIGGRRALIPLTYYQEFSGFIVRQLENQDEIQLLQLVENALNVYRSSIRGDISWYLLNVKQDLEARKIIKVRRGPDRIQVIRLKRRYKERLAQDSAGESPTPMPDIAQHLAS